MNMGFLVGSLIFVGIMAVLQICHKYEVTKKKLDRMIREEEERKRLENDTEEEKMQRQLIRECRLHDYGEEF